MAELNNGDPRTRFCHIVHHIIRVSTVERLQIALQSVVNNASGRNLKEIMAGFGAAPVGLQFLFAIEKLNYDLDNVDEDELWVPIRKMTIGNNLVAFYKASCDEADSPGSTIAQACEDYVAKRVFLTGQHRKSGESNRSIIKAMVSAHLYGLRDEDIGSGLAGAKQDKWENKLQSITPYWEIASICGGPGIFLLVPPRSVDV